jgi:hypothetical protein
VEQFGGLPRNQRPLLWFLELVEQLAVDMGVPLTSYLKYV